MKYILKKEYPGSPKLGNTIDNLENDWIENYPEFWELVVEKDYEILSLIEDKFIYPCDKYSEDFINQLFNTLGVSIHSLKRLSDSEIFTIGDKVVGYNNSTAKIKTIDLVGEVSLNIGTDKSEGFSLKNLKKAKKPLLITADGVDIFEGDLVVCFDKDSFCIRNKTYLFKEYDKNDRTYLFFSTKEKAEEYILMNKPCLSLNDIENAMDQTSYLISSKLNKFRDYLKSKIQQSV